MKKMKLLCSQFQTASQTDRRVQRMRNIIVILALFVCTSICLGLPGQTITINRDAGEWNWVWEDGFRWCYWNEHGSVLEVKKKREWKHLDIAGNGDPDLGSDDYGKALTAIADALVDDAFAAADAAVARAADAYAAADTAFARAAAVYYAAADTAARAAAVYAAANAANVARKARHHLWKDPNNNRLIINPNAKVGNVSGAKMNKDSVKGVAFRSMTNNEVIVNGGDFGSAYSNDDGTGATGEAWNIAGAFADDDIAGDMNVSSNTVRIKRGRYIRNVYGGHAKVGTVSSNTVTISSSVEIRQNVYGGRVFNGTVSSNTVTMIGGKVLNVYGGYIIENGTATLNTVKLTDVVVGLDVYGARIGKNGDASSNTVTITSGTVGNVYGGLIPGFARAGFIIGNGTAILNTVNLTSVIVKGDACGAKVVSGDASQQYSYNYQWNSCSECLWRIHISKRNSYLKYS